MSPLKFGAEEVAEMKYFYQEELTKTLRRLEHINEVLSQLGEKGSQVSLTFAGERPSAKKTSASSSAPKRKYKKKRGPKSKWDKAIMKTITAAGRPLSYDEVTNHLMISEGRDSSKRKNTKATVQNTIFRMRHDKKVDTFSLGSRTKYIAPKEWFDATGTVEEKYRNKIATPKKATKPAKKKSTRGPGRPRKKVTLTAPKAKAKKATPVKRSIAKSKKAAAPKPTPKKAARKKAAPRKPKAATAATTEASATSPVAVKKAKTPRKSRKPAAKKAASKSSAKPVAEVKVEATESTPAKAAPAKKARAKKPTAKKSTSAKKPAVKKAVAKKPAAKKPAAKKVAAKKPSAKKKPAAKMAPTSTDATAAPRKVKMKKTVKSKK